MLSEMPHRRSIARSFQSLSDGSVDTAFSDVRGTGDAGEDLSMEESLEATPAKKRGRPRKSDGGVVKSDEAEVSTPPGSGKRKMVEAVLDPDNLKRPCHGKNGMPKRQSSWNLLRSMSGSVEKLTC